MIIKNRLLSLVCMLALLCPLSLVSCADKTEDNTNGDDGYDYNYKDNGKDDGKDDGKNNNGATVNSSETEKQTAGQEEVIQNKDEKLKAALVDGYWENNIQAPNMYKFYSNNTVEEYSIDPSSPPKSKDDLELSAKGKYQIKDEAVSIEFESVWGGYTYQLTLELVSLSDNYKWDAGIKHHLPANEPFLYETGFVPSEMPTNAFYMKKSSASFGAQSGSNTGTQMYAPYHIRLSANPTPAELKKALVGRWQGSAAVTLVYHFYEDLTCRALYDDGPMGTYDVTSDKSLIIDLSYTKDKFPYDANSLKTRKGWCVSSEGNLVIEGIEYRGYRIVE